VGSLADCTRILGLVGCRVTQLELDGDGAEVALRVHVERRGVRRYPCSGCGRRTGRVRDATHRTWRDVPWALHPVTLVSRQRRVRGRPCGIRCERVEFADPKARLTRRRPQRIGVDGQSMPTSHAALRHAVRWGAARRAERRLLERWDAGRPRRGPRHLGADEIPRGQGQHFWTVLSDIVHGEVIGLAKDRTEEALTALLTTALAARQRTAVEAVCLDRHRPDLNAVTTILPKAEVVFDKFHVRPHAAAALDEVRRHEFFRAGPVLREFGRGTRWLLLRRGRDVRGKTRQARQALCAANRRLFTADIVREPLDRLWTYTTRPGVLRFVLGWIKALRWQRLPEMARLGELIFWPLEGIAASGDHAVRFGVVESLNTTINAVLRRARGMKDEAMLVRKRKWATARPIRTTRDLRHFLHPETVESVH
jgi:transposase